MHKIIIALFCCLPLSASTLPIPVTGSGTWEWGIASGTSLVYSVAGANVAFSYNSYLDGGCCGPFFGAPTYLFYLGGTTIVHAWINGVESDYRGSSFGLFGGVGSLSLVDSNGNPVAAAPVSGYVTNEVQTLTYDIVGRVVTARVDFLVSATPEPSTLCLFAIAALAIGFLRDRGFAHSPRRLAVRK